MRAILSPDGSLQLGASVFQAVIGAGGVRADKKEGDHGTPVGLLPLRRVFYRADRVKAPQCAAPVQQMLPTDGWCDDPADRNYNCYVTLPYRASHEQLWRDDRVYDIVGVLGWNDDPPVPGRGSAIFLHMNSPDRAPTEGCIALDQPDLRHVLAAGLTEILVLNRPTGRGF